MCLAHTFHRIASHRIASHRIVIFVSLKPHTPLFTTSYYLAALLRKAVFFAFWR